MKHFIFLLLFLICGLFGYGIGDKSARNSYLTIEAKISQEMKDNPTKYNDDYSLGYSIGLIKCSRITYDVLRRNH